MHGQLNQQTQTHPARAGLKIMHLKTDSASAAVFMTAILLAVIAIISCASRSQSSNTTPTPPPADNTSGSRSAIWSELLQKTPFPHTAPLPPQVPTVLDGTYTKFDPKKTPAVPCRRCPDYVPEGGIWKLHLSKGVFRIFHEFTGWRSIGSFVVEGTQVKLFNDPTCIEVTGTYTWTLKAGRLNWVVVQDECAIEMRAKNLMQQPWLFCQPPSMKANWEKPPGCD
jgi:hypothetical protein